MRLLVTGRNRLHRLASGGGGQAARRRGCGPRADRPSRGAGQRSSCSGGMGVRGALGEHHRRGALPPGGAGSHPHLPPGRGHAGGRQERRVLRVDQPRWHPASARGGDRGTGRARSSTAAPSGSTAIGRRASPGRSPRSRRATSTSAPRSPAERLVREFAENCGAAAVDPPAGRRLRPPRPAAAQAVQGREPRDASRCSARARVAATWSTWTTSSPASSGLRARRGAGRGAHRGGPEGVYPAGAARRRYTRPPAARATASGCRSRRCWRWPAVVEDICAALGVDPPIYRRRMDFFHSDSEFDTSRARRVLDWEPRVDLSEGIRRTLEDYRSTGALAA